VVKPVRICECCGQSIPDPPDEYGLSELQRKIFDVFAKAGTCGLSRKEAIDQVYADDPTGGPASRNVMSVHTYYMNKKIKQFGWRFRGQAGRGGRVRLERIPAK
jgi:hypothetical protein